MSTLVLLPPAGLHERTVMRTAAEKFNVSVKDGINHLVQNKIIPNDSPYEVARVFHSIQVIQNCYFVILFKFQKMKSLISNLN